MMYDEPNDEPLTLKQRQYQQDLMRHPDCRDPDHPGCPVCDPEEEE